MTRTDIHRPSAPEFDPQAYEFFGCFDLSPDPVFDAEEIRARRALVSSLVDQGWKFTSVHGSGQCGHCGARIRYAALMGHEPTKGLIWVGETCLDNRFSLTKGEFDRLRKNAMLNRERTAKAAKIAAVLAEHPALAYASYAHNIEVAGGTQVWVVNGDWTGTEYATEEEARATLPERDRDDFYAVYAQYKRGTTWASKTRQVKTLDTLGDIWGKVERYSDISEKQAAFVERMLGWLDEAEQKRVEREAATAAVVASGVQVPEGRIVVEGEVLSTKWVDNDYGSTQKMLVQNEAGWKVWGSVPSSLDVDKGDRVQFTATVTKSDDDPLFGFFKRPAKATKI